MKIDLNIDTKHLQQIMGNAAKQLPRDITTALNTTAFAALPPLRESMKQHFDRPTKFTLNALKVRKAAPGQLNADVWVKDSPHYGQTHYLWPQIKGGTRDQKRHERWLFGNQFAVPGRDIAKDSYGNLSRGLYSRILSQTNRSPDAYQNQTAGSKAKRKARAKRGGEYFLVPPGQRLAPGVWERIGTGFGSAIKPVLVQTRSAPQYHPRWPFFDLAGRFMAERFPDELDRQVAKSIAKHG